jgi:hypothetical protein
LLTHSFYYQYTGVFKCYLQEYTDRLFDDFMRDNIDLMLVESEAQGRHTMKNGAKCLCQLVHDQLLPDEI